MPAVVRTHLERQRCCTDGISNFIIFEVKPVSNQAGTGFDLLPGVERKLVHVFAETCFAGSFNISLFCWHCLQIQHDRVGVLQWLFGAADRRRGNGSFANVTATTAPYALPLKANADGAFIGAYPCPIGE